MKLSPYLLSILGAWVASQLFKYLIDVIKTKSVRNAGIILRSGGMPSVHSAVMMSVVTTIGLIDGFSSGLFALALAVAIIVMYDALQVRRAVGEQGIALSSLLAKSKIDTKIHYAKGHLPLEVAAGGFIGVVVAFFITTLSR